MIHAVTEVKKELLIFSNGQILPSKTESVVRVECLDKNGVMQYQTNSKPQSMHNVLRKHQGPLDEKFYNQKYNEMVN